MRFYPNNQLKTNQLTNQLTHPLTNHHNYIVHPIQHFQHVYSTQNNRFETSYMSTKIITTTHLQTITVLMTTPPCSETKQPQFSSHKKSGQIVTLSSSRAPITPLTILNNRIRRHTLIQWQIRQQQIHNQHIQTPHHNLSPQPTINKAF